MRSLTVIIGKLAITVVETGLESGSNLVVLTLHDATYSL